MQAFLRLQQSCPRVQLQLEALSECSQCESGEDIPNVGSLLGLAAAVSSAKTGKLRLRLCTSVACACCLELTAVVWLHDSMLIAAVQR